MIRTPNGRAMQGCPACDGSGVQQGVIRVPWALVFNAVLAAGQQNLMVQVQQDTDADFEWVYSTASSYTDNGGVQNSQNGLFSAQVRDMGTGRLLTSDPMFGELHFGAQPVNGAGNPGGQIPSYLPEPYIVARGTALQMSLSDRPPAVINSDYTTNTVQVTLHGYKLVPANAPMQGSAGVLVHNRQ